MATVVSHLSTDLVRWHRRPSHPRQLTTTHTQPYQTVGRIAEAQNLSYGDWDWWHKLVEERERFRPDGRMACVGMPHKLFYPENGETPNQALTICRGCEVRVECLQHALDNNEADGVWGGVTESRRRKSRRKGATAVELIARQDSNIK